MKRIKKHRFGLVIGLLAAIILASCSAEQKLARTFVERTRNYAALVLFPDIIYKTNQKTFLLDSLGVTDEAQFDSVLLAHSRFLSKIDDSLFMANYVYGFTKELSALGLKLFGQDQMADFLELDSNAYVFNVAQLELEETIYTQRDDAEIYGTYYYHDQDLDAVFVNAWIEISQVDKTTGDPNVYFATGLITDHYEGQFTYDPFSGNIRFVYRLDSLQVSELYTDAYRLGRAFASYTFDLLLNDYLDKHLPADQRSDRYWRYNPYDKTFFPATDDRLVPLDE